MQERGLSISTVAKQIGVSKWSVWRWVRAGKISAYRLHDRGLYKVPRSALEAFAARRAAASDGPEKT